jgi:hypothetical protein
VQKRVRLAALRSELRSERRISGLEPLHALGMLDDHRSRLGLERLLRLLFAGHGPAVVGEKGDHHSWIAGKWPKAVITIKNPSLAPVLK